MRKRLAEVRVDRASFRSELEEMLNTKETWNQGFLESPAGQALVDFISDTAETLQHRIVRAREESSINSSKMESSVKVLTRTLGVRLSRKTSLEALVDLQRDTSTESLLINRMDVFTVKGIPFFNPDAIFFDAGETTKRVTLREGTVVSATMRGNGSDFQTFRSEERDSTVSNLDVHVSSEGEDLDVVTDSIRYYPSPSRAVQDTTLATGELFLIFGNSDFGYIPEVEETLNIQYAVVQGTAVNSTVTVGSTVVSDREGFSGTVVSVVSGEEEIGTDTYKAIAPFIYAARGRMVSQDDFRAYPFNYPGVADALIRTQRDVAPSDERYLNIVNVTLLLNRGRTISREWYDTFEQWYSARMSPNLIPLRADPLPYPISVSANVYITEGERNFIKDAIIKRLRSYFSTKVGSLGKDVYLNNLHRLIKDTSTSIDFVEILIPTGDVLMSPQRPKNLKVTVELDHIVGETNFAEGVYEVFVTSLLATESSPIYERVTLAEGVKQLVITWDKVSTAINGYNVYIASPRRNVLIGTTTETSLTLTEMPLAPAAESSRPSLWEIPVPNGDLQETVGSDDEEMLTQWELPLANFTGPGGADLERTLRIKTTEATETTPSMKYLSVQFNSGILTMRAAIQRYAWHRVTITARKAHEGINNVNVKVHDGKRLADGTGTTSITSSSWQDVNTVFFPETDDLYINMTAGPYAIRTDREVFDIWSDTGEYILSALGERKSMYHVESVDTDGNFRSSVVSTSLSTNKLNQVVAWNTNTTEPDTPRSVLIPSPEMVHMSGDDLWVASTYGELPYSGYLAYSVSKGVGRLCSRNKPKDIVMESPGGMWSNTQYLWAIHRNERRVLAFDRTTLARVPTEDFSIGAVISPEDMWCDGITLWVTDSSAGKLVAYDFSTKLRSPTLDIDTAAHGNSAPQGIWSDFLNMWVANKSDDYDHADGGDYVYGYSRGGARIGYSVLSDTALDSLEASGKNVYEISPQSMCGDVTGSLGTVWVLAEGKAWAFDVSTKNREPRRDINFFETYRDFNSSEFQYMPRQHTVSSSLSIEAALATIDYGSYESIATDGTTMWLMISSPKNSASTLKSVIHAYDISTKLRDTSKDITPSTVHGKWISFDDWGSQADRLYVYSRDDKAYDSKLDEDSADYNSNRRHDDDYTFPTKLYAFSVETTGSVDFGDLLSEMDVWSDVPQPRKSGSRVYIETEFYGQVRSPSFYTGTTGGDIAIYNMNHSTDEVHHAYDYEYPDNAGVNRTSTMWLYNSSTVMTTHVARLVTDTDPEILMEDGEKFIYGFTLPAQPAISTYLTAATARDINWQMNINSSGDDLYAGGGMDYHNGRLWISAIDGVYVFDDDDLRFRTDKKELLRIFPYEDRQGDSYGVWVGNGKLYIAPGYLPGDGMLVYDLSTERRDTTTEGLFSLSSPLDIWSDGTTMWVISSVGIKAYYLASGAPDPSKDLLAADYPGIDFRPKFISGGTLGGVDLLYVVSEDKKIYIFNVSTKAIAGVRPLIYLSSGGTRSIDALGIAVGGGYIWLLEVHPTLGRRVLKLNATYAAYTGFTRDTSLDIPYIRDFNEAPADGTYVYDNVGYCTHPDRRVGLCSDGTTLWVSGFCQRALYGFHLFDLYRGYAYRHYWKDFRFGFADGEGGESIWADSSTVWTTGRIHYDENDEEQFEYRMLAYDRTTQARVSSKDIRLDNDNRKPGAIWSDGVTVWIMDKDDNKAYAYTLSTKARDATKDISSFTDGGHTAARGIWSDDTTTWISNGTDTNAFAYTTSTGARDTTKDITYLNHKAHVPQEYYHAEGIWSKPGVVWVARTYWTADNPPTARGYVPSYSLIIPYFLAGGDVEISKVRLHTTTGYRSPTIWNQKTLYPSLENVVVNVQHTRRPRGNRQTGT